MKKYLVKFEDNWADEMDLAAFKLVEAENIKEVENSLVNDEVSFPCEHYVGTNESVEYSSRENYLKHIKIIELSGEEYKTLNRLFPYGFGEFVELVD